MNPYFKHGLILTLKNVLSNNNNFMGIHSPQKYLKSETFLIAV